jgi:hypothetical protein
MPDASETRIPFCPERLGVLCLLGPNEPTRPAEDSLIAPAGLAERQGPLVVRASFDATRSACLGAVKPRRHTAEGQVLCCLAPETPKYDRDLRRLWAGDVSVHTFAEQAKLEPILLEAFEAQCWRCPLEKPLGKLSCPKYGAWLKTAVHRLNDCQEPWLIRFGSRPSRLTITWQWKLP